MIWNGFFLLFFRYIGIINLKGGVFMEEQKNNPNGQANPRRKPRSKMQNFKEAYLPVIIIAVAVILIIVFIIGSIVRAVEKSKLEEQADLEAAASQQAQMDELNNKVNNLILQAEELAAGYDYDGAMDLLGSFEGDMNQFPQLADKIDEYAQAKSALVEWADPSKIPNLSVQLLIADPQRAFNHETYSYSFKENFITLTEFSSILQQLYDNGYILVGPEDIMTAETDSSGKTVYQSTPLYLPSGKKPLMLTQTNVNYNLYLVDSDGDMIADKNGGGFASKLILDQNGKITCEMVDSNGQTVYGAYDMIPILDEFVARHPDFSYRGAKAILAVTGYNGLFGYRTNAEAKEHFGQDAYTADVATIKAIAQTLRDSGYTLACYTYENIPYGTSTLEEIQTDLTRWNAEVLPILGSTNTLVYAQKSDITTEETYSGDVFNLLQENGFRYYIGFCQDANPWMTFADNYVRQGRLMVTGANLRDQADLFTGLFDASAALDTIRNQ